MTYIVDYVATSSVSPKKVGGKGFNLSKLYEFGFKVPSGFIVTSDAYQLFLVENNLQNVINKINSSINVDNLDTVLSKEFIDALQTKILSSQIPDAIKVEIEKVYRKFNSSLAIRSSASNEDSANYSFAGIFDSFLNVQSLDAVYESIVRCYASLWSKHALAYGLKNKVEDSSMAVVITEMVPAVSSGIAFTCNPTNGNAEQILIDTNFGIGESVVDGRIEPDSYIYNIDKFTIESKKIGSKKGLTILVDQGTYFQKDVENDKQVLSDKQIEELSLKVKTINDAFDTHQDIEWVYDGEDFVFVQSRPITTFHTPYPIELANQQKIYSNANVKDAAPFVQCTLNKSFYEISLNHLMGESFRSIDYPIKDGYIFVKSINGRIYFDLLLIQWLWFDSLGLDPKETNNNFGGHQRIFEVPENIPIRKKFKQLFNGIKYMNKLKSYIKQSSAIFKAVKEHCDSINVKELAVLSNDELKQLVIDLNKRKRAYGTNFIMLASAVAPMNIMIKILDKYFPQEGAILVNALLSGQSNVTTAEHGYRLIRLAKIYENQGLFNKEFNEFIEEFGHRSIYEIDLQSKRWNEDASYLLGLIEEYRNYDSFDQLFTKQKNDTKKVWEKIDQKVPYILRIYLKKLLKESIKGIEIKEMAKSTYIRFIETARKLFIECGNRIDIDPFHCSMYELITILEDKQREEGVKKLIVQREELYAINQKIPAADVIHGKKSEYVEALVSADGKSYKGIAVASGIVKAKVKKINHPSEYDKLKKGEILVAPSTDPAWTPMFLKASGIVLQTGGYLSHGSIVAREFAIPAVVNVGGVMNLLEDGQEIIVDGDKGEIVLK